MFRRDGEGIKRNKKLKSGKNPTRNPTRFQNLATKQSHSIIAKDNLRDIKTLQLKLKREQRD